MVPAGFSRFSRWSSTLNRRNFLHELGQRGAVAAIGTTLVTPMVMAAQEFVRHKQVWDAIGRGELIITDDEVEVVGDAYAAASDHLIALLNQAEVRAAILPDGSVVALVDDDGEGDVLGVVSGEWVVKL
jgi:hypothetical protein